MEAQIEKNLELLKFRYGTWKEVARRLGVVESTVYRWRKGITKPNRKNQGKLLRLRYGSWREVAKRLGVAESTLYRWRKGITKPNRKNKKKLEELMGEIMGKRKRKRKNAKIVIYGTLRSKKEGMSGWAYFEVDTTIDIEELEIDADDVVDTIIAELEKQGIDVSNIEIGVQYVDEEAEIKNEEELDYFIDRVTSKIVSELKNKKVKGKTIEVR